MNSLSIGCTTFLLFLFAHEAKPQQINRDAARAGRQHTQSIESSVADLRSQVLALQQANRDLVRRLDALEPTEVDKSNPNPGGRPQIQVPPTSQQSQFEDTQALRTLILQVVGPELQRLENRIMTFESTYEDHTHRYKAVGMGWTNFMTAQRFPETCPGCLIAFRRPREESTTEVETTGPE